MRQCDCCRARCPLSTVRAAILFSIGGSAHRRTPVRPNFVDIRFPKSWSQAITRESKSGERKKASGSRARRILHLISNDLIVAWPKSPDETDRNTATTSHE